MFTRKEYLAVKGDDATRWTAFRRFYGEIIEDMGGAHSIPLPFSIEEIREALAAGDEHLNTLPLSRWDSYVSRLHGAGAALRKRGDYLTLGTGVCILKEAARLRAEAEG